ncbi:hypothetical protein HYW84_01310 [Candidatus Peregrinibacteria bacterium]|nr:hypothetical protein [Candidatus Peregrinibacteria bacterium]
MKLPSLPFVVLDTETTGLVPKVHKVIEFASVEVRDGEVQTEYDQLFHNADVPPVVQTLTRIRTTDLTGMPVLRERMEDILRHIPKDALIVGQNIAFDIGMLKGEGIDLSDRPLIDTAMLASLVFPELESYSLGYLSAALKLNHEPRHRALGDARATLELLGKCWERLLGLPQSLRDLADAIMERGPNGYKMFFKAIPASKSKKEPAWMKWQEASPAPSFVSVAAAVFKTGEIGVPDIVDEPLYPEHLQCLIEGAMADTSARHWIAVKNLRRTAWCSKANVRVIRPPNSLVDVNAVLNFARQKEYTADEATLALKLAWYEPGRRDQFPLHGGEESVWNGKLSCTAESKEYLNQFSDLPSVVLVDHRELLEFLQHPDHPGARAMNESANSAARVIIDDASMLEDTSTKAYGWFCSMDDMRAAAQGDVILTRFADTLQLWVEKVRQFQDIRYLTSGDLGSPDCKGLLNLLEEIMQREWPAKLLRYLEDLRNILQTENLAHRIAWIEQKPNGSQILQSVPERIGRLLSDNLFKRFSTTLLVPQGSAKMLPEILPPHDSGLQIANYGSLRNPPFCPPSDRIVLASAQDDIRNFIPIAFEAHPDLEAIFMSPISGKIVIILPGKSAIEDLYIKYSEALEAKGTEMICQGMSGGMGRMQAEFLASGGSAVWLVTPWMFEGTDLPTGTVNRLILKALPFDHPNHPVLSRRAQHYRDPFNEYSLPRLMHRLFRLLRTFARIRTTDVDVRILDDRITTKAYGKTVKAYLEQFSPPGAPSVAPAAPSAEAKDAKEMNGEKRERKKNPQPKDQMALF